MTVMRNLTTGCLVKERTMTKRVVNSREVLRLWASAAQDSARSGSVFFEGDTVYSYGRHWPLARICRGAGGTLVLTNSRRYSVTTAKHQGMACGAVGDMRQTAVPVVEDRGADGHAVNLAYLTAKIATRLDRAARAMQTRTVERARDAARQLHNDRADYATFFEVESTFAPFPEVEFAAAFARAGRIENPTPAQIAKRTRVRALRRAWAMIGAPA